MKKNIQDLGVSSFLLMHKRKVVGKHNKAIVFEIADTEEDNFNLDILTYLRSQYHGFDNCLMSLKKLINYLPDYSIKTQYSKTCYDLGSAAFLMLHGWEILGCKNRGVVFKVEDSEAKEFEEKQMEYLRGPFHEFDSALMSLKKINENY